MVGKMNDRRPMATPRRPGLRARVAEALLKLGLLVLGALTSPRLTWRGKEDRS